MFCSQRSLWHYFLHGQTAATIFGKICSLLQFAEKIYQKVNDSLLFGETHLACYKLSLLFDAHRPLAISLRVLQDIQERSIE